MPLNLIKIGTSVAYGAVDIGAEYFDQKQGYVKPFENIADWERILATVGGATMAYMDRGYGMMGSIGESLMLSSIPLTEKSIVNAVQSVMPKSSSKALVLTKRGSVQGAPLPKPTGQSY